MDNIPRRSIDHGQRSSAPQSAQMAQPVPPVSVSSAPQPIRPSGEKVAKKNRRLKPLLIGLLGLIVIVGLIFGGLVVSGKFTGGTAIDSSKYQAVFLSNGQVYFGKLQNSSGEYLKLTNVFYLQTKTDPTAQNPQTTAAAGSNVELIKLGSEIHGPEDQMLISRSQVLFYENLKPDGRVSQSISNYVKK
ncbi:MAG: hypothetical protein EOT05_00950 [Candidatus Microsaccharimonas sossegonensis]|uniref:Uncharacterized protein n=1 Tax=Candidatus Microsaccharimonas sossegonensis TaxID=2506948 RepID=A0A4Q0AI69_9BACT|nr:MAG: hypothetical protein EOT05_00950 [Candidatus Microsaccharimonas sossegonensis]